MAKLTAKKRSALPKSSFAQPGARKYPIQDKSHAINAKARATQMKNKGKLSPAGAARVIAKANKVIGC